MHSVPRAYCASGDTALTASPSASPATAVSTQLTHLRLQEIRYRSTPRARAVANADHQAPLTRTDDGGACTACLGHAERRVVRLGRPHHRLQRLERRASCSPAPRLGNGRCCRTLPSARQTVNSDQRALLSRSHDDGACTACLGHTERRVARLWRTHHQLRRHGHRSCRRHACAPRPSGLVAHCEHMRPSISLTRLCCRRADGVSRAQRASGTLSVG